MGAKSRSSKYISARVARQEARDAGLPLKLWAAAACPARRRTTRRMVPTACALQHCTRGFSRALPRCKQAERLRSRVCLHLGTQASYTCACSLPLAAHMLVLLRAAAVAYPRCCYSCYHTRCIHGLLFIPAELAAPAAPPLRRLEGGPPTALAAAAAGRRARAGAAEWPAKEARGWLWCAVLSREKHLGQQGAGRTVLAW